MRFDVITIFPDIIKSFGNEALIARAQAKKIISINPHFLRQWGEGPHRKVDDRPYGGGAGMVMMAQPIALALKAIENSKSQARNPKQISKSKIQKKKIIVFSAKGKLFTQATARRYAKLDQLIMICGRYEGIDERVAQSLADEEVSIGEYVLFGGEVPAMVVMEAVTRLLPSAVGKIESIQEESFKHLGGIEKEMMEKYIEYPHYTRPETIEIKGKKRSVPSVLLSGNHKKIDEWRHKHSNVKK